MYCTIRLTLSLPEAFCFYVHHVVFVDITKSDEEPGYVIILFRCHFWAWIFVHFLPERIEAVMGSLAEVLWALWCSCTRSLLIS